MIDHKLILVFEENKNILNKLNSFMESLKLPIPFVILDNRGLLETFLAQKKPAYLLSENEYLKELTEKKYPETQFLYFSLNDLDNRGGIEKLYNASFYSVCTLMEGPSAKVTAKIIHGYFKPQTLIDIGCGSGIYLREFRQLGVDVTGIDKNPVAVKLCPKEARFYQWDFKKSPVFPKKFDLALCFEVAEHIPTEDSDTLVSFICSCSDLVVFSAAPPGQGGIGHINEQPNQFWLGKFENKGYAVDYEKTGYIREAFKKSGVVSWLINNTFILYRLLQ